MNKPISVGDLVVVVKPKPCCGQGALGMVFRVTAILTTPTRCLFCKTRNPLLLVAKGEADGLFVRFSRLKRIPPLVDLESTEETIREAA